MTYETNTVWTSMHKKEIEELNSIVSNQYRIEQQIAHKIHFIKLCREIMQEAISEFNFDVVIRFMKQVGWKWAYTENGCAVPTRADFIKAINEHFNIAMFDFIECNKNTYGVTTGGLTFEMICKDLEYPSKHNTFCNIGFDISTWHDEFAED